MSAAGYNDRTVGVLPNIFRDGTEQGLPYGGAAGSANAYGVKFLHHIQEGIAHIVCHDDLRLIAVGLQACFTGRGANYAPSFRPGIPLSVMVGLLDGQQGQARVFYTG